MANLETYEEVEEELKKFGFKSANDKGCWDFIHEETGNLMCFLSITHVHDFISGIRYGILFQKTKKTKG